MRVEVSSKNTKTLRAFIVVISLTIMVVSIFYQSLAELISEVSRNPYIRVGERSVQLHQLLLSILAGVVALMALMPRYTIRPLMKLYDSLNSDLKIYTNSYKRWVYIRNYIALSKKCLEQQEKLAKMQR